MRADTTRGIVDRFWNDRALPTLEQYIEIPNLSPFFDPSWRENGHMDRAVDLLAQWARSQDLAGAKLEVLRPEGKSPLIFMEIDGAAAGTVLLYGHLDKQPEMTGWDEGLDPWKPVRRGERLFGRGAADDGYAIFGVIAAVRALQEQHESHPRLVVLIESTEESGSFDLPWYVDHLKTRIGTPDLVVCLDSGCGNYDQLWMTNSLRGVVTGELRVQVLDEGVHSGDAGGIVPSSFRVLRQLLDRFEDSRTGEVIPQWMHVDIPERFLEESKRSAAILGDEVYSKFPFAGNTEPLTRDPLQLILNRTWQPSTSYVAIEGLPALQQGGNVLRPYTTIKLSIRTPPTLDAGEADRRIKELFESQPPYGANVTWTSDGGAPGWLAPEMKSWLAETMNRASNEYYGREAATIGEGGSIPFMGMLHEKFPEAQFVVTGVLGPHSNAHGPNEFLDIPTVKKLTCCIAAVISEAGRQSASAR
ncbi:MAG TPA: M20 family metallopeptidase [Thermoanaerobaculia bacterium]|nr:M20 family metallopeptidase [Thermoanaerobaculia bacterium]